MAETQMALLGKQEGGGRGRIKPCDCDDDNDDNNDEKKTERKKEAPAAALALT